LISKIRRIDNFGIYRNFSYDDELQEFKKYNLFYGWNGSGKSTLSRLFRMLEKREISDFARDAYFEIEFKDGQLINPQNISDVTENILVFNQDFIEENIDWDQTVESILLVSEEKIEERKELKLKYEEQKQIEEQIKKVKKDLNKVTEHNQKSLSKIAKDIKNNFKFLSTNDTYYLNYNKTKLEKLIQEHKKTLLEKSALLDEQTLDMLSKAAKPEMKNTIGTFLTDINFVKIEKLIKEISNVLKEKILSKTIEKLQNNHKLSLWVEEGLELHRHNNFSICEFCGNKIDEKRIEDLENHFNISFKNLKSKLILLLQSIESEFITTSSFPTPEIFYEELQKEYVQYLGDYELLANEFNTFLVECKKLLNKKIENPFEVFSIHSFLTSEKKEQFENIFRNINNLINTHNNKTKFFESKLKEVQKKLELHYATEALHDLDYFVKDKENSELNKRLQDLISKDRAIQNRILELNSSLLSAARGADEFNKRLTKFLGHQEISLEFDQIKKGYNIIRNINGNKIKAKNLSEGEKTAIAFIYFITKLKEYDDNINNTIVIIDDPISSFDANNLFNSYSYLRDECNETKQLFVFTHNFAFYRLVRDWMKGKNKTKSENGKQVKIPKYSLYSIETNYDTQRQSSIVNAHNSLTNYETEYHYIFYRLYQFKDKSQLNIEESYLVANLARKLLESFLSFKHPKKRNDFRKLVEEAFDDETTLERVYKFINKYSHHQYFDFQDHTSDNLLGESQNIIGDIFKAIENKDIDHYKEMLDIINIELVTN
jgi:wobble nucleotide-excising tRNase